MLEDSEKKKTQKGQSKDIFAEVSRKLEAGKREEAEKLISGFKKQVIPEDVKKIDSTSPEFQKMDVKDSITFIEFPISNLPSKGMFFPYKLFPHISIKLQMDLRGKDVEDISLFAERFLSTGTGVQNLKALSDIQSYTIGKICQISTSTGVLDPNSVLTFQDRIYLLISVNLSNSFRPEFRHICSEGPDHINTFPAKEYFNSKALNKDELTQFLADYEIELEDNCLKTKVGSDSVMFNVLPAKYQSLMLGESTTFLNEFISYSICAINNNAQLAESMRMDYVKNMGRRDLQRLGEALLTVSLGFGIKHLYGLDLSKPFSYKCKFCGRQNDLTYLELVYDFFFLT